jgi:acetoin utilization protein AcuC
MSARAAVVWTREFLTHRFNLDHPLDPVRLALTMRLVREFGVLEGSTSSSRSRHPTPSWSGSTSRRTWRPCERRRKKGDDFAHGLGTDDNPIFEGLHEASCLVCGGSRLAAREIAEGRADRAVNIAGGRHHAMPNRASGLCVYNDCAVAISWLLDHGVDRIADVDVDVVVHHGDGVQAAFYTRRAARREAGRGVDDPRVLTISLPTEMTDGADVAHAPWRSGTDRVEVAILETRRAVFPLRGLDPHDPRD